MTSETRERFGKNIETEKFLIGVANYPAVHKLAKIYVGDSFVDWEEALVFIGEVELLCKVAFKHCLGNDQDPDAIHFLRDMKTTRGFKYVYPQQVADYLNETFEPKDWSNSPADYCPHWKLTSGECCIPCNLPVEHKCKFDPCDDENCENSPDQQELK